MNINDFTDELILRLESEWGSEKAEKLKLIHAIGDDERKVRLEKILKLSSNKLLKDRLLNDQIMLPPSTEQECGAGTITLGKVCFGKNSDGTHRELYPLRLNLADVQNHTIITGLTGTGKTTLAYNVAEQLEKQGISVIVFDWNRTWRNLLTINKNVKVYTIGRDISPFSHNLFFSPPKNISLQNWLGIIAGTPLSKSLLSGLGVESLILNEAENLIEGYTQGKLRLLPNVEDIKKRIEKQFLRGRTALWQQSAVRVLTELCRPTIKEVFGSRNPMSLADEIFDRKGITILEMDIEFPNHLRILFQETLLTYLMLYQLSLGEQEKLTRVIIFEEFQNMLGKSKIEIQAGHEIIQTLFKESRKFGAGLIALAQEPSELSNFVLANCKTQIHFATTTFKDVSTVANGLFLKQHEIRYIDYIWRGEAITKVKGRTKNCLIKTLKPLPLEKVTDEELKEIAQKWEKKN